MYKPQTGDNLPLSMLAKLGDLSRVRSLRDFLIVSFNLHLSFLIKHNLSLTRTVLSRLVPRHSKQSGVGSRHERFPSPKPYRAYFFQHSRRAPSRCKNSSRQSVKPAFDGLQCKVRLQVHAVGSNFPRE